jgi:hypothetical protein
VEAIKRFTDPKNVTLFGSMNVFNKEECEARQEVLLVRWPALHIAARLRDSPKCFSLAEPLRWHRGVRGDGHGRHGHPARHPLAEGG